MMETGAWGLSSLPQKYNKENFKLSMAAKRDNFLETTKKTIAERVSWRCSFPGCSAATIGPNPNNPGKSLKNGKACHIAAASPNGPRYDANQTQDERKAPENGIWLCGLHADLIDNDEGSFSDSTLKQWKKIAESIAYDKLRTTNFSSEDLPTTLIQIGHNIVIECVWADIQNDKWAFRMENFIIGNQTDLDQFLCNYPKIDKYQKYLVVESQGDGRTFKDKPRIQKGKYFDIISFPINEKVARIDSDKLWDAPFVYKNGSMDLDFSMEKMEGNYACIQNMIMLLGTEQGGWFADIEFGTFTAKYYKLFKDNFDILGRIMKLEISRKATIPEKPGCLDNKDQDQPSFSYLNRVDFVRVKGIKDGNLILEAKLQFSDGECWEGELPLLV